MVGLESNRDIIPIKPGNIGGGRTLTSGRVFEANEVRGIGLAVVAAIVLNGFSVRSESS
jgi:hypothetical protein